MENEVESLKSELAVVKKVLSSHPALITAMEKLVAKAHAMATNSTTHSTTNSTHEANDIINKILDNDKSAETNGHKATEEVFPGLATHQWEAYDSDSNRHGDHKNLDDLGDRKLLKDQDVVGRGAAKSDSTARDRDTINNDHSVLNRNRNYPQEVEAPNGNSLKASKKPKHSKKEELPQDLPSKTSLGGDSHNPNGRTQFVDSISDEKRGRKLDKAVEAPD